MTEATAKLRSLLQEFVEARLDAPDLFARAGALLPAETDPYEEVLELLAEGDLQLTFAGGRRAFIRRLEQFASGEASYTELGLWGFSLEQTQPFSPEAAVSSDPEMTLLQEVAGWIDQWEDEAVRPDPAQVGELARILTRESDPARCLTLLEEALARFGREPF